MSSNAFQRKRKYYLMRLNKKWNMFIRYIRNNYQIYFLMLPAIIFIFIFHYIPMYGVQIAFRNFTFKSGIWGSEWAGLVHFKRFITGPNFWPLIRNTLAIKIYSLIFGFPVPILLALMLNEVRMKKFKKTIQMLSYIPHFISVVAICGLILLFTDRDSGIINTMITSLGGTAQDFRTDPKWFRTVYIISGIWQTAGWSSIIYIAALSSISHEIIEAALIDGVTRFQKIIYIDLPSIMPTISILFIFNIGSLMSLGHQKVLLLQNTLNMETSDVISTYIYRVGILNTQYSFTTAIGLFTSVINAALLISVNQILKKMNAASLW